ncbi:MAG: aquaporin [Myxococcota bacterium]|nr:aquaporin [Myxococcota bacterium]
MGDATKPSHDDALDEHADARGGTPYVLGRRLFTESFGTFLLVCVDCGGAMVGKLAPEDVTPFARAGAMGLLIVALIFSLGNTSGAHFNPAVTFSFAVRRAFPWSRVPLYWVSQLLGAFAAVAFLRYLLGDIDHLGATLPRFGAWRGFVAEVLLTCILVTVVLGTATRHRSIGPNAAFASGAAVALCALFSRPLSGASMNPARSLAPAVLSGEVADVWIYLTAPFLGALLACIALSIVHSRKHGGENVAAQGEDKEK